MNGVGGPVQVQKATLGRKILRGVGIFVVLFVILFVAGVIWRMPIVAEQDRSAEVVKEIEGAHLILADVDGSHLPPAIDEIRANATVEGVDANANGIRDDVELAIFAKYPVAYATSTASTTKPLDTNLKLRAAELQYAKALQMYLTSVFTKETLSAVAWEDSRAYFCLDNSLPFKPAASSTDEQWRAYDSRFDAEKSFVDSLVLNSQPRKSAYESVFDKYMSSHGSPNTGFCDLERDI